MLHRQRTILFLIREAGGEAGHTFVTKCAFLLRHEAKSGGGGSFYDFLPYKYGPFSFCLFQEMGALARQGLIRDTGSRWALTAEGHRQASPESAAVARDVSLIVSAHQNKPTAEIVEGVYARFPWFTANSEIRRLVDRRCAPLAVYTAGYQGLLVDRFLDGLLQAGISQVLDVRSNPVSRRYGYHKSTLRRLCGLVGIKYVHLPELGISSDRRRDLNEPGVREALLDEYEQILLPQQQDALERAASLVLDSPTTLLCMEACPTECHRSRLALPLAHRTGLDVVHLELHQCKWNA